MALKAGTRLGPYEIVDLLGAGGMGEVYRARDTRLDRSVAVKVLPAGLAADPEVRDRFEREARTVAELNHPHICVLHDVGRHDGTDFLVMEHVAGGTLAKRLEKGPLPIEQVLRYGTEIADALDKAHRQGVVHRDLKPANVMVTKDGTKLLDFGLAKLRKPAVISAVVSQAATADRELTAQGTLLGTLQYMAPEQLEGEDADARTDIFALGAVLYEMATGRKAFDGKSQVSLIASILEHEPAPISTLQPLSPAALEHLIGGCLAKAPEDRWQTARDAVRQLKWIAAGGGGAPAATAAAASSPRKARLGWIVAAALAVVALGVSILAVRNEPAPESAEPTRFEISTPQMPNAQAVSVSPDGRRIAFAAANAAQSTPVLYVRPWTRSRPSRSPAPKALERHSGPLTAATSGSPPRAS
jgi:serine/threonine protein kinase